MPRQARTKSNSGIYHLMLRGINRQNIFEEDNDRKKFITTLGRYQQVSQCVIYAYCLMNNHVHLLIKENEEPISIFVKRISGSYVLWYNKKYSRYGHLFQERFKSEAVESDQYFLTVLRYIHQNPVKAGLEKDPGSFPWSSYGEYICNPHIIDVGFALEMFSENIEKAIILFEQYMNETNNDQCLDDEAKIIVPDKAVLDCLNQLGISHTSELHKLDKMTRDKILHGIRQINGVSLRQVARITGISKSVIERSWQGQ